MSQNELDGKHVVVMGLGRFGGGIAVSRWLVEAGASVIVTDQADAGKLADSVAQLADLPVTFHLGGHDEADLDGCDLLVVSPAVPKERSGFVQAAIARQIPISSEMNLFVERCPARRVIGVTGSAGKSTTTAMIGAVLEQAVKQGEIAGAWTGGNIGRSLLSDLPRMNPDHVVTLELSSFQLEDLGRLRWSPSRAVIMNITPNHLDRHGTMAAYIDAKMNLVRFQGEGARVFVPEGQEGVAAVEAACAAGRIERFAFDEAFADTLRIPGEHNRINAAAAIAVARSLGISDACIRKGLSGFTGLPHRLEFVAEHGGVRYYNDSKSTTPESTLVALDAFDGPVVMLIGGTDKQMSFTEMAHRLACKTRAVVCYGATGGKLFELVARSGGEARRAKVALADSFEDAVNRARDLAQPGDVVVLSPACSSYDMFTNYEQRGERFCELVRSMAAG